MKAEGCSSSQLEEIKRRQMPPLASMYSYACDHCTISNHSAVILPSNVCDAQINRGWVTLGQNFRMSPSRSVTLGLQKANTPGYLTVKLSLKISNLCDHNTSTSTDGQTDRRTDRRLAAALYGTALCVASRGKNL